jgi:hypothetical protein
MSFGKENSLTNSFTFVGYREPSPPSPEPIAIFRQLGFITVCVATMSYFTPTLNTIRRRAGQAFDFQSQKTPLRFDWIAAILRKGLKLFAKSANPISAIASKTARSRPIIVIASIQSLLNLSQNNYF